MADKKILKKVHSTPGVYFSEIELTYSSKSLGVTRLGVAGETQKGPAFQPIEISDWSQFQTFFGGTNTEKFAGSQYPKYELPYIAKEYLTQSQQLQVCRVLGLSGVNAGPAWFITAYHENGNSEYTEEKPVLIAVLRSRGEHVKAMQTGNDTDCGPTYEFDKIKYYAKEVKIGPSTVLYMDGTCKKSFKGETGNLSINQTNYGTFTLYVETPEGTSSNYSVSLNPGEKNYILNVLGQDPEKGDTEIFVEELYDIALEQLIFSDKINHLTGSDTNASPLPSSPNIKLVPKFAPADGLLKLDESTLTRRYVGKRYLATQDSINTETKQPLGVHTYDIQRNTWAETTATKGCIYTVVPVVDSDGTRKYYYREDSENDKLSHVTPSGDGIYDMAVFVVEDNAYYIMDNSDKVIPILMDMNNYKEQYRYASTPWIVSELKGSATNVELTRLFRFHTISDGNNASTEVKVSIENITPDEGTFDVVVRDYNDSDKSVTVLEKYKGCNLIPGSENYIAYRIGSTDENYETRSKFITVEVNETDKTKTSIPAGFLGYPVRDYSETTVTNIEKDIQKPFLQYNTNIDEDLRIQKQYFGLSDIVGIDSDVFKYKGVEAYNEIPSSLTPGFHLDSRIFSGTPDENGIISEGEGGDIIEQKVTVDGTFGYSWQSVGKGNTLDLFNYEPVIGHEDEMEGTIYEDKRARKFTVCFYGGWDGWDYYRSSRSNSDDFTYRKYRGTINEKSGEGENLNYISNPEAYGFDKTANCLNSDYYAYLSAIRMFGNPKTIEINHLATPGIDYINNNLLVGEVIEMVEEERGDTIYVVTTPDKPFGAGDSALEMYTPSQVVDNLEDTEIDSNYVCSSYPWNKYFDAANSQYIYLPPTKDMVRNFAYTDNVKFPWYAAVGWNRGTVNAIAPKKSLKLLEQDELYDGRLNFTNTFAQDGLRLWGDKNFQKHESPMNRISHRRALNRIKTLLSKACVGLLFDPNDTSMAKSLESAIKPVLENIKSNKGLVDYRIKIDDSEEARERLELNAQVYLKLMPNLEYINITLAVLPNGMQISEV